VLYPVPESHNEVVDAIVVDKFVVVALLPVAFTNVKSWSVEELVTKNVPETLSLAIGVVRPTPIFPAGSIRRAVAVEDPTTNWLVSPAIGFTASLANGDVVPRPKIALPRGSMVRALEVESRESEEVPKLNLPSLKPIRPCLLLVAALVSVIAIYAVADAT